MKNVILTLLVYLSYVVMVNASTAINIRKEDTLSKRVINGLEIVPIRTKVGCCKELETIHWKLHVPDFDKSFQKFESKYPGYIGESLTHEMVEMLADWKEHIWTEVIPTEIKALLKKCVPSSEEGFILLAYVDKEGCVFEVEFIIMKWDWFLYNKFGTCHPTKLKKMVEDGSMEKIFDVGGKK